MMEDSLPVWCERCDKQGFVCVDDAEHSYFAICERCGWETSLVFCPKCMMGGEFVSGIDERPTSWVCPSCDIRYELPANFYNQPVPISWQSSGRLDHLIYEEKLDIRFLHGSEPKRQLLLTVVLLGGPFVLLGPFLILVSHGLPLWPLLPPLLLNLIWALFVGVGHRSMSWDEFASLSLQKKRQRMYYDSAWYYLYVGGTGLFPIIASLWSTIWIGYFGGLNELFDGLGLMLSWLGISGILLPFGVRAISIAWTQYRRWHKLGSSNGEAGARR